MFRGRYKALLVDADEYLAAVVRHIHLNAVEARMVKMPEDYLWASHRYYVQNKGAPVWLDTTPAMEQLGGRQAFHEFVLSGNEETLKKYYESKRQSLILGCEAFIEQVIRSASAAREHPRYERHVLEIGPERVINEVVRQYKVAWEEIFTG